MLLPCADYGPLVGRDFSVVKYWLGKCPPQLSDSHLSITGVHLVGSVFGVASAGNQCLLSTMHSSEQVCTCVCQAVIGDSPTCSSVLFLNKTLIFFFQMR